MLFCVISGYFGPFRESIGGFVKRVISGFFVSSSKKLIKRVISGYSRESCYFGLFLPILGYFGLFWWIFAQKRIRVILVFLTWLVIGGFVTWSWTEFGHISSYIRKSCYLGHFRSFLVIFGHFGSFVCVCSLKKRAF